MYKCPVCSFGQFAGPSIIGGIACLYADTVKRVHPAGKVVKILTVLLPFKCFILRFVDFPFIEGLANS